MKGESDHAACAGYADTAAMAFAVIAVLALFVSWASSKPKAKRAAGGSEDETPEEWSDRIRAEGEEGERRARGILKRRGYRIVDSQPEYWVKVQINGSEKRYKIKPDFIVAKGGSRFVVEVKKSVSADPIGNRYTRRQVMDYYMALRPDGVFTIDAENEQIHHIDLGRMVLGRSRWKVGFLCLLCFLAGIAIDWSYDWCSTYHELALRRGGRPGDSTVLTFLDYYIRKECGY